MRVSMARSRVRDAVRSIIAQRSDNQPLGIMLTLIKGHRDALEGALVRELFSGDGGTERAHALARNLDKKGLLRVVAAGSVIEPTPDTRPPPESERDPNGTRR